MIDFWKIEIWFGSKLSRNSRVVTTPSATPRCFYLRFVTVAARCARILLFFLHAERAGTGRDLVTRHPSEISSFAVDIERRIYKSKRGSAKFTRAFSPIGPPDISDLSMPPGIYERVVRIVIKARYRIFICDAICIYM